MRDALGVLTVIVLRGLGAKNTPKYEPILRPGTMLPKVKMQERWAKHKSLVERVLPNKS